MTGKEMTTKHALWAEWTGWPVWAATGFIFALVFGAFTYKLVEMLGYGRSLSTTFGSLVFSATVYGVLLAILLSIKYIRTAVRGLRSIGVVMSLVVGALAIAVLCSTQIIGFAVFAVLLFLTGMLFVLTVIPVSRRTVTKKILGIQRDLSWSDLGLGIAGYVIYFMAFIGLTILLGALFPAYNSTQAQDLGFTALYGTERIIGFIVLVVITPIVEELIMRGFLFGKLRESKMPFWPAAIVVSILFGAAHGQWNVAVDTFVLSMVACYLREITGTIWPGVVIHMAKNAVAYVLLFVIAV